MNQFIHRSGQSLAQKYGVEVSDQHPERWLWKNLDLEIEMLDKTGETQAQPIDFLVCIDLQLYHEQLGMSNGASDNAYYESTAQELDSKNKKTKHYKHSRSS